MFTASVLDGAASLKAERLAEGVEIAAIEGKGRGLVATRDFLPGEVVVREAPYAAVVTLEEMESTCSGEFTPLLSATGSRCSGCKSARCSLSVPDCKLYA